MGAKKIDPDTFDVDVFMKQFLADTDARLAAAGYSKSLDRSRSRDLTDEELRTLNRAYVKGVEELKIHHWNLDASKK